MLRCQAFPNRLPHREVLGRFAALAAGSAKLDAKAAMAEGGSALATACQKVLQILVNDGNRPAGKETTVIAGPEPRSC